MNPTSVTCFKCSKCAKIWLREDDAKDCCLCKDCGAPKYFDLPRPICKPCFDKHKLEQFLKMPKVPYAGEMIFDDAHDNYFASLEDLEDWLAYCEEEKVVLRLRTCRKIKARKFEVPAFLEPDEESGYTYDYDAAEKLEDHVNSFLEKAQGDIYTPDWQRIDMETLLPLLSEESRSQLDLSLESLPATS